MTDSITAISSSLQALNDQYESITHNLANASTPGYKRRVTAFSQSLAQAMAAPVSAVAGSGSFAAAGVTARSGVDFAQANLVQTGRGLDLALDGKGFFVIETPQGPLYTRCGTFQTNAQGQLVDSAGRTVAGQSGPIVLPSTASAQSIHVSKDGQVSAGGQTVGKIRVVRFDDASQLQGVGGNCFRAPEGVSPADDDQTRVQQGFQEASNVNVVEELVGLITVSRLYEANLKNIQAQDERSKSLLQVAMS